MFLCDLIFKCCSAPGPEMLRCSLTYCGLWWLFSGGPSSAEHAERAYICLCIRLDIYWTINYIWFANWGRVYDLNCIFLIILAVHILSCISDVQHQCAAVCCRFSWWNASVSEYSCIYWIYTAFYGGSGLIQFNFYYCLRDLWRSGEWWFLIADLLLVAGCAVCCRQIINLLIPQVNQWDKIRIYITVFTGF